MEAKGYEERVKVYLRVLGDSTLSQYPQTVHIVSKQTLRFVDYQPTAKLIQYPEGFLSREKLAHTPTKTEGVKLSETAGEIPPTMKLEKEFTFDHIFEPSESLEFLRHFLSLEPGKLHCLVSLGKSDTVSSPEGLAVNYLRDVFGIGGEVSIGCAAFSGEKVTNFLSEPYEQVSSLEEVLRNPGLCDFFQGKKPKDSILVLSVFHTHQGVTGGVQFVEAVGPSRTLSLLCQAVTNSDAVTDLRTITKLRLFEVLRRTLCSGSQIFIVGNVCPVEPYNDWTAWVLRETEGVMSTRQRCVTFSVHLLLKNVERLEAQVQRSAKIAEDREVRYTEEKAKLIEECETLKASLKQAIIKEGSLQSDFTIRLKRSEQELNDLKDLMMLRETELLETKGRIRDLEAEEARRKHGISTQFQSMSQPVNEKYESVLRENEALRRTIAELEVVANGLKACMQAKSSKVSECVQIDPPVAPQARLRIVRLASICILPGDTTGPNRISDEVRLLADQLRSAELELQRLRSVPPPSPRESEDMTQSRALYNLLSEVWRYTDSALRSFKDQFDKMSALMEFRVADRELKIALLEHRIQQTDAVHTGALRELEVAKEQQATGSDRQSAYIRELEEKIAESRGKIEEIQSENGKLKEEFAKKMHEMKDNYKKSIKELKNGARNREAGQTEEVQETVRRLQAEIEERNEEIVMERERAKTERRELELQISALKDLRKPLGAANRK